MSHKAPDYRTTDRSKHHTAPACWDLCSDALVLFQCGTYYSPAPESAVIQIRKRDTFIRPERQAATGPGSAVLDVSSARLNPGSMIMKLIKITLLSGRNVRCSGVVAACQWEANLQNRILRSCVNSRQSFAAPFKLSVGNCTTDTQCGVGEWHA